MKAHICFSMYDCSSISVHIESISDNSFPHYSVLSHFPSSLVSNHSMIDHHFPNHTDPNHSAPNHFFNVLFPDESYFVWVILQPSKTDRLVLLHKSLSLIWHMKMLTTQAHQTNDHPIGIMLSAINFMASDHSHACKVHSPCNVIVEKVLF